MPKFEKEEYDVRITKVPQSMAERNIEVLIVTDPFLPTWHSCRYMTVGRFTYISAWS